MFLLGVLGGSAVQDSEYLPQRREGAKVFRKKFFSELGAFAPLRDKRC
jgi:hypothetical protein